MKQQTNSVKLLTATILATIALIGCGDKDELPSSMPGGYERVDNSFAILAGQVKKENGVTIASVAEIRANDGYGLYQIETDCAGKFSRGTGTVFTSDGTIEEQIPGLSEAEVAAHPQYLGLVNRACLISTPPVVVATPAPRAVDPGVEPTPQVTPGAQTTIPAPTQMGSIEEDEILYADDRSAVSNGVNYSPPSVELSYPREIMEKAQEMGAADIHSP